MNRAQRELYAIERLEKRKRQSLGRRLDTALSEARLLPGVGCSRLERESRSAENDSVPMSRGELMFSDEIRTVFDSFERRARVLLLALEQELDAHKFGASGGLDESTEGRDARLRMWVSEGLTVQEIALYDPGQGNEETVRRSFERLKKDD